MTEGRPGAGHDVGAGVPSFLYTNDEVETLNRRKQQRHGTQSCSPAVKRVQVFQGIRLLPPSIRVRPLDNPVQLRTLFEPLYGYKSSHLS